MGELPIVAIDQIGFEIRGRPILRRLSMNLQAGEFCLIFGPNGAGKTTLLRIMAGLLASHSGTVRIAGSDTKRMSRRQLALKRAYLGQSDEFALPLTVREVLETGRFAYRSPFAALSANDRACIEEVVDRFALARLLDHDIRLLSGGERKRALIASALVQDVPLICLDEPLNFLDPAGAREVLALLAEMHRDGRTVVVVSHALELFFPLADSLAALKGGELVYAGKKKIAPDLFRAIYGVGYGTVTVGSRTLLYWNEE